MSLILNAALAKSPAEQRIMNAQWAEVQNMRSGASLQAHQAYLTAVNAGQSPAEAYREFDSITKIDMVPAGEHATVTRLMQKARPVNLGREVFEYRKASATNAGQSSMSGQIGVKLDNVDYTYGGTVIPVHDYGFGRRYREMLSMQADGVDSIVDDAREGDRSLMTTINSYLWNGDANLSLKGKSWLGIKADPTVATATIGLDLTLAASTAENMRIEIARIRDILYITNNCTQGLRLGVSREIMSNWERPFSTADGMFGTIQEMIAKLRGIAEIYEDSELSGNELVLFWDDQQGFHPVVGMGLNTYAVPRMYHNDDFNYIKWAAVGFLAKTDASSRKCALYGS